MSSRGRTHTRVARSNTEAPLLWVVAHESSVQRPIPRPLNCEPRTGRPGPQAGGRGCSRSIHWMLQCPDAQGATVVPASTALPGASRIVIASEADASCSVSFVASRMDAHTPCERAPPSAHGGPPGFARSQPSAAIRSDPTVRAFIAVSPSRVQSFAPPAIDWTLRATSTALPPGGQRSAARRAPSSTTCASGHSCPRGWARQCTSPSRGFALRPGGVRARTEAVVRVEPFEALALELARLWPESRVSGAAAARSGA